MKLRCFIESFIDVGSGLILAILIQLYIFPFFGLYGEIFLGELNENNSVRTSGYRQNYNFIK